MGHSSKEGSIIFNTGLIKIIFIVSSKIKKKIKYIGAGIKRRRLQFMHQQREKWINPNSLLTSSGSFGCAVRSYFRIYACDANSIFNHFFY
jgi:hypothetical protein